MQTSSSRQRGIALILVLAFLVLIAVFIVGFFTSAQNELSASGSYAAAISTNQLADTAMNLVEGQIRSGTTRPAPRNTYTAYNGISYTGIIGSPGGSRLTFDSWVSQPGLIRTFQGGPNASRTGTGIYKLYSSNNMIVQGTSVATFYPNTDVSNGASGWQNQPALWTDLNEAINVSRPANVTNPYLSSPWRYPILNPTLFTYNLPYDNNGGAGAFTVPGASISNATDAAGQADTSMRPARMPVRWLYVLKDGDVVAPSGSSNGGTIATFTNAPGTPYPSATNPIVGRIAFWTDDDCCKVNINTAGGFWPVSTTPANFQPNTVQLPLNARGNPTAPNFAGSYWDTPRMCSRFDMGQVDVSTGIVPAGYESLALSQPRSHEYQRYPGHPMTTSLAMVFNGLFSSEQIYSISPRIVGGGSMGGLVQSKPSGTGSVDMALMYKSDRLYSSVDELLYAEDPNLPGSTLADGYKNPQWLRGSNPPTSNTTPAFAPPLLDQMRFFLTAHSRAPELNVFGRPRVTIWPIWPVFDTQNSHQHIVYTNDPPQNQTGTGTISTKVTYTPLGTSNSYQSMMDQVDTLIAFCSTIGPFPTSTSTNASLAKAHPFIFQRSNPYSATEDCSQILRNEYLLGGYLREMMETPIPGYGGAFNSSSKYGGGSGNGSSNNDHLQILMEIFDYIRSVNLRDSVHDTPPDVMSTPPKTTAATRNTFKYAPNGIVVPSVAPTTWSGWNGAPGFGRFPTISEAALVFYHSGYVVSTPAIDKTTGKPVAPVNGVQKLAYRYVRDQDMAHHNSTMTLVGNMMSAFLVFATYNPMQGFATIKDFAANGADLAATDDAAKNGYFFSHSIKTTGFTITTTGDGQGNKCSLYLPATATNYWWDNPADFWNGRNTGGMEGFLHTMAMGYLTNPLSAPKAGAKPIAPGGSYYYPFQSTPPGGKWPQIGTPEQPGNLSAPFKSPYTGLIEPPIMPATDIYGNPEPTATPFGIVTHPSDNLFKFSGGTVTLTVNWGPGPSNPGVPGSNTTNTYTLTFPGTGSTSPWPVPTDNIWYGGPEKVTTTSNVDPGGLWQGGVTQKAATGPGYAAWYKIPTTTNPYPPGGLEHSTQYSLSGRIIWARGQAYNPWSNTPTVGSDGWMQPTMPTLDKSDGCYYGNRWRQIFQPGDTIRSLVPANGQRPDGDPRVIALVGPKSNAASATAFVTHPWYYTRYRHAQTLRMGNGYPYFDGDNQSNGNPQVIQYNSGYTPSLDPSGIDKLATTGTTTDNPFMWYGPKVLNEPANPKRWYTGFGQLVLLPTGYVYPAATAATVAPLSSLPPMPQTFSPAHVQGTVAGGNPDFDTGLAALPDGAFCGKPDEGDVSWKAWNSTAQVYNYEYPYFQTASSNLQEPFNTYFSPSRQIPSAVCFGSLLAGRARHWQTLVFSPNPASGTTSRPGTANPPDHVLLDFFTMPVVEPYPISDPFSTAGKININYSIVPFTHIERSTALRAALQSVRIPVLSTKLAPSYKSTYSGTYNAVSQETPYSPALNANVRFPVNLDQTIAEIDAFFSGALGGTAGSQPQVFRSASEICEMYLYPNTVGITVPGVGTLSSPVFSRDNTTIAQFWSTYGGLTGDNLREKPYNDLYARVTAKSNTFTVYMRVQALRKRPVATGAGTSSATSGSYLQWDETKDQVLSEYRGYTTIERYLDPLDRRFDNTNTETSRMGDYISPELQNLDQAYKFRVVEKKRFSPYQ